MTKQLTVVLVLSALLAGVAAQYTPAPAAAPESSSRQQGEYPSDVGSPGAEAPAWSSPPQGYPFFRASAPIAAPPYPTTVPAPAAGLPTPRVGFYRRSCPRAEKIVRRVVRRATSRNAGVGAGIIRMLFHDCFVQGCDASVLLDPTTANPRPEKLGPPNFPSLRGFEVIDAAKAALETACPGVVSCADTVAFAARDAAYYLSRRRIHFSMPAGRYDGRVSFESEALSFLPPPSFNLSQLVASFKAKNLDVDDLVVLSGAHTVGTSHCSSFTDRLPPNRSDMSHSLSRMLQRKCPAHPNFTSDPTVAQDAVMPDMLDSRYYKNVLGKKVLFASDAALLASRRTSRKVVENAFFPGRWERKFARAMVKMAAIEVKTAADGEIRKNCRVVNKRKRHSALIRSLIWFLH